MSQAELACTYAALMLYDDGAAITADKINKILKAADVKVEPYWPTLFAKFLEGRDLGSLISNTGAGAAPAPAAATPAASAAAGAPQEAKKEEPKKEEPKEESDEDMGFGLFD